MFMFLHLEGLPEMVAISSAAQSLPEVGSTEVKVFLLHVGQTCAQICYFLTGHVILADPSTEPSQ